MNLGRIRTQLSVPAGTLKPLVEEVLAAIDRLHKVPDLPPVAILYMESVSPYARYRPSDDNPVIELSSREPYPRLSLAHEIGHLLDHALADFGVYSSYRLDSPISSVMAAMNTNEVIEAKIEQAFRSRPWRGLISVEEAIADAVRYRRSLNETDRQLYDEQILAGRHPSKALGTVEIVSGRDQPCGSQKEDKPVAVK